MSLTRTDILIVGMGPVGLAAAFEAARNGNKVTIIDKRTEAEIAIRPQVVVIDPERKKQLLEMLEELDPLNKDDLKFIEDLAHSAEVKLKNVQKFILNRIHHMNIYYRLIKLKYGSQLAELDLNNGSAVIKTKDQTTEILFGHLIAADGARSDTLALVNPALTEKIERDTPKGMEHLEDSYHLGAYIKLSRVDKLNLELPQKEFVSSYTKNKTSDKKSSSHELYFLRFDKKSHDKSHQKKCQTRVYW